MMHFNQSFFTLLLFFFLWNTYASFSSHENSFGVALPGVNIVEQESQSHPLAKEIVCLSKAYLQDQRSRYDVEIFREGEKTDSLQESLLHHQVVFLRSGRVYATYVVRELCIKWAEGSFFNDTPWIMSIDFEQLCAQKEQHINFIEKLYQALGLEHEQKAQFDRQSMARLLENETKGIVLLHGVEKMQFKEHSASNPSKWVASMLERGIRFLMIGSYAWERGIISQEPGVMYECNGLSSAGKIAFIQQFFSKKGDLFDYWRKIPVLLQERPALDRLTSKITYLKLLCTIVAVKEYAYWKKLHCMDLYEYLLKKRMDALLVSRDMKKTLVWAFAYMAIHMIAKKKTWISIEWLREQKDEGIFQIKNRNVSFEEMEKLLILFFSPSIGGRMAIPDEEKYYYAALGLASGYWKNNPKMLFKQRIETIFKRPDYIRLFLPVFPIVLFILERRDKKGLLEGKEAMSFLQSLPVDITLGIYYTLLFPIVTNVLFLPGAHLLKNQVKLSKSVDQVLNENGTGTLKYFKEWMSNPSKYPKLEEDWLLLAQQEGEFFKRPFIEKAILEWLEEQNDSSLEPNKLLHRVVFHTLFKLPLNDKIAVRLLEFFRKKSLNKELEVLKDLYKKIKKKKEQEKKINKEIIEEADSVLVNDNNFIEEKKQRRLEALRKEVSEKNELLKQYFRKRKDISAQLSRLSSLVRGSLSFAAFHSIMEFLPLPDKHDLKLYAALLPFFVFNNKVAEKIITQMLDICSSVQVKLTERVKKKKNKEVLCDELGWLYRPSGMLETLDLLRKILHSNVSLFSEKVLEGLALFGCSPYTVVRKAAHQIVFYLLLSNQGAADLFLHGYILSVIISAQDEEQTSKKFENKLIWIANLLRAIITHPSLLIESIDTLGSLINEDASPRVLRAALNGLAVIGEKYVHGGRNNETDKIVEKLIDLYLLKIDILRAHGTQALSSILANPDYIDLAYIALQKAEKIMLNQYSIEAYYSFILSLLKAHPSLIDPFLLNYDRIEKVKREIRNIRKAPKKDTKNRTQYEKEAYKESNLLLYYISYTNECNLYIKLAEEMRDQGLQDKVLGILSSIAFSQSNSKLVNAKKTVQAKEHYIKQIIYAAELINAYPDSNHCKDVSKYVTEKIRKITDSKRYEDLNPEEVSIRTKTKKEEFFRYYLFNVLKVSDQELRNQGKAEKVLKMKADVLSMKDPDINEEEAQNKLYPNITFEKGKIKRLFSDLPKIGILGNYIAAEVNEKNYHTIASIMGITLKNLKNKPQIAVKRILDEQIKRLARIAGQLFDPKIEVQNEIWAESQGCSLSVLPEAEVRFHGFLKEKSFLVEWEKILKESIQRKNKEKNYRPSAWFDFIIKQLVASMVRYINLVVRYEKNNSTNNQQRNTPPLPSSMDCTYVYLLGKTQKRADIKYYVYQMLPDIQLLDRHMVESMLENTCYRLSNITQKEKTLLVPIGQYIAYLMRKYPELFLFVSTHFMDDLFKGVMKSDHPVMPIDKRKIIYAALLDGRLESNEGRMLIENDEIRALLENKKEIRNAFIQILKYGWTDAYPEIVEQVIRSVGSILPLCDMDSPLIEEIFPLLLDQLKKNTHLSVQQSLILVLSSILGYPSMLHYAPDLLKATKRQINLLKEQEKKITENKYDSYENEQKEMDPVKEKDSFSEEVGQIKLCRTLFEQKLPDIILHATSESQVIQLEDVGYLPFNMLFSLVRVNKEICKQVIEYLEVVSFQKEGKNILSLLEKILTLYKDDKEVAMKITHYLDVLLDKEQEKVDNNMLSLPQQDSLNKNKGYRKALAWFFSPLVAQITSINGVQIKNKNLVKFVITDKEKAFNQVTESIATKNKTFKDLTQEELKVLLEESDDSWGRVFGKKINYTNQSRLTALLLVAWHFRPIVIFDKELPLVANFFKSIEHCTTFQKVNIAPARTVYIRMIRNRSKKKKHSNASVSSISLRSLSNVLSLMSIQVPSSRTLLSSNYSLPKLLSLSSIRSLPGMQQHNLEKKIFGPQTSGIKVSSFLSQGTSNQDFLRYYVQGNISEIISRVLSSLCDLKYRGMLEKYEMSLLGENQAEVYLYLNPKIIENLMIPDEKINKLPYQVNV